MSAPSLLACPECDLLQRDTDVPPGGVARCRRCEAILYRNQPDSIDRSLAYALAAAVVLLLANVFPIVGLEVQGKVNSVALYGAISELWDQDMQLIAALVFCTTLLFPALELGTRIYILLPLRLGAVAPGTAALMRLLHAVEPWGMLEVFTLGVLVALVKLAHIATIIPGVALWSFGALILLLAACSAAFDPHQVWARTGRA